MCVVTVVMRARIDKFQRIVIKLSWELRRDRKKRGDKLREEDLKVSIEGITDMRWKTLLMILWNIQSELSLLREALTQKTS